MTKRPNLEAVQRHMRARDHLNALSPPEEWRRVYDQLADDVPDLVAWVEYLERLFCSAARRDLEKEVSTLRAGLVQEPARGEARP